MKPVYLVRYVTQLGAIGVLGDGRMPFMSEAVAPLEELVKTQRMRHIEQGLQPNTYDVCELVPLDELARLRQELQTLRGQLHEIAGAHNFGNGDMLLHNITFRAHALARDCEAAGYHVEITRKPLQPFAQGHALTHVEIWPTTAARHAAEAIAQREQA